MRNIFSFKNYWIENCSSWSLLLNHDIFVSDDPVWKAVEIKFFTVTYVSSSCLACWYVVYDKESWLGKFVWIKFVKSSKSFCLLNIDIDRLFLQKKQIKFRSNVISRTKGLSAQSP